MMAINAPRPRFLGDTVAVLKTFPRPVWILFAGTFLNKFGTFVIPFLALYMTRLGFSTTQAGLAIGAYGVGLLAASTLGGHLADTIGRRKTIVLSMFSAAVAMLRLVLFFCRHISSESGADWIDGGVLPPG